MSTDRETLEHISTQFVEYLPNQIYNESVSKLELQVPQADNINHVYKYSVIQLKVKISVHSSY